MRWRAAVLVSACLGVGQICSCQYDYDALRGPPRSGITVPQGGSSGAAAGMAGPGSSGAGGDAPPVTGVGGVAPLGVAGGGAMAGAGAGGTNPTGGSGGASGAGGMAGASEAGRSGAGGAPDAGSGGSAVAGASGGAAGTPPDGGAGAAVKLPTPLAEYSFDQPQGTKVLDSSGNQHDGTGYGSFSYATGRTGDDLLLDGTSGTYVALPADLEKSLTDITIAFWVRPRADNQWQRVFDFGSSTTKYMFFTTHAATSNVPRFAITTNGNNNEQGINHTAALPIAMWSHIAIVLSKDGGTLYVNGASSGTNNTIKLRPSDIGAFPNNYIGRSQWANDPYFNGEIEDFRIYSSALSATDIAALYALP